MSKEPKKTGSDNAGSPDDVIKSDPTQNPNDGPNAGQSGDGGAGDNNDSKDVNLDNYVDKKQYEDLETKLGKQGEELGDYRKFLKEVSPLLDKLQAQPELIEAIMDGKIDSELAKSVLEGKLQAQDAKDITKAHDEVKKDLGKTKYDNISKDDLEKLVSEKFDSLKAELKNSSANLDKKIRESDEKRDFESSVNEFIANTPDFDEHADDISKWFEDHPDQYDIEIAYNAVKGKKLVDQAKAEEDKKAGENAKDLAGNAKGGYSTGGVISESEDIDKLIGNSSNPNAF